MRRFVGSGLQRVPSISQRWTQRDLYLCKSHVWGNRRRFLHCSRQLLSDEKVVKPAFIPFLTPPEEEDRDYQNYRRTTAKDIAPLAELPTRTKMLVRDFIDNSLYNPNYGYFSKQAVIFSPEKDFDFPQIRDHLHFMNLISKKYKEIEGDVDEVDEVARQVWHTPTELFKVSSHTMTVAYSQSKLQASTSNSFFSALVWLCCSQVSGYRVQVEPVSKQGFDHL